ncbi:MAG: hypothetical protein DRI34_11640 [Deltaproteobacteria bacterium]|nr:MAG: hypothetical protein DRI34_11640 [Deltaproteobacteria bacterium]
MKSTERLQGAAEPLLLSAWNTLGLPFDVEALDERERGIIDPEVAILLTVMCSTSSRAPTDIPAWILRFSDMVNHGKLKALMVMLGDRHREAVVRRMRRWLFAACPKTFRRAVSLPDEAPETAVRELLSRRSKIAPVEVLAESSAMLRNRLLYGTGFRADLISVVEAVPYPLRANQLARLLGCRESTVSRILRDLRAAGLLDGHNQLSREQGTARGIFISVDTLRNIINLIDAMDFSSEDLRSSAVSGMDLRFDGMTRSLVESLLP